MLDKIGFDDADYSIVVREHKDDPDPVEMGDLSRRYIECDRPVAAILSHYGGR